MSYWLFTLMYKLQGEDSKHNPHILAYIYMVIPYINMVFPIIMIFMNLILKPLEKIDYKKLFRIK